MRKFLAIASSFLLFASITTAQVIQSGYNIGNWTASGTTNSTLAGTATAALLKATTNAPLYWGPGGDYIGQSAYSNIMSQIGGVYLNTNQGISWVEPSGHVNANIYSSDPFGLQVDSDFHINGSTFLMNGTGYWFRRLTDFAGRRNWAIATENSPGPVGNLGFFVSPTNGLSYPTNFVANFLSNGNFGIGEANPVAKLAVHGGVAIGTNYSAGSVPNNGLLVEGGLAVGANALASGSTLHVQGNVYMVTTTAPMAFGDITSIDRLTLVSSGNRFRFYNTANGYASLTAKELSLGWSFGSSAPPADGLLIQGNTLSGGSINATNGFASGAAVGITTIWTNMIPGVITQRISTVNGLVCTNLTL